LVLSASYPHTDPLPAQLSVPAAPQFFQRLEWFFGQVCGC
jgi:hypothetical protein